MIRITHRLRLLGLRALRALHLRIAHVTACLRQLDECAALGGQRVVETFDALRRRPPYR
jgi:hypothetical protein